MSEGNWVPLAYMFIAVLVLAGVIYLSLTSVEFSSAGINPEFNDTEELTYAINQFNSSSLITFNGSITIFSLNSSIFPDVSIPIPQFHPLFFLPQNTKNSLIANLVSLTYVPRWILIPMLALLILAFIWTGVKLILP